jgi:hypothetical protein
MKAIGPDGSLYKCPGFVGLRTIAGDDHDEFNEQGEWQIGTKKWDDDCESATSSPTAWEAAR